MNKSILFLTDGMADEALDELDGKTPLEVAHTPYMDRIAREGASGTFLTLPDGFADSSDVANMSVFGYDVATHYCGRGPLEAVSQNIDLQPDDIAYRCNLVTVDKNDVLTDYSGGHIADADARILMKDLAAEFNCDDYSFYPGVSFRNILVLHGSKWTEQIHYHKPDASVGKKLADILPTPMEDVVNSPATCDLLIELMTKSRSFLEAHPYNKERTEAANMIFPCSPGRKPYFKPFEKKYGARGAVVSAVDVIFGIAACAEMTCIHVEGATGWIDTNFEGKAAAAVKALDDHDFVYLHVEAADEVGHMGDVDLKIKTIEMIDKRLLAPVMDALEGQSVTFAVCPDHPVAVKRGVHTRTPVPFAICGEHIKRDDIQVYSETQATQGGLGYLKGDALMRKILNCKKEDS